MKHSLFRKEAVEARRGGLHGDVRLDADLGAWVLTLLLATIVAVSVAVLGLGEYPRRETVSGRLLPDRGVALVRIDRPGRVVAVHADEGASVAKGAPLVTMDRDVGLAGGGDANERLMAQMRDERRHLERRLGLVGEQLDERRALLVARRGGLAAERAALERQLAVSGDRAELAERHVAQIASLAERGVVTETERMRRDDARLAHLQDLAGLHTALARSQREFAETEAEIAALEVEGAMLEAELRERLAVLDQRLTDAARAGVVLLRAPFDGTIGAVLVRTGEDVAGGSTAMMVLPEGATLHAELFAPSRAAGFIAPGQRVRLRYDAFAHQTFGVAEAVVTGVSRTAVSPASLGLEGAPNTPVFRVTAALKRQSITAYGAETPLQAGMTLTADIVVETRALWALLLDPVLAAARR